MWPRAGQKRLVHDGAVARLTLHVVLIPKGLVLRSVPLSLRHPCVLVKTSAMHAAPLFDEDVAGQVGPRRAPFD